MGLFTTRQLCLFILPTLLACGGAGESSGPHTVASRDEAGHVSVSVISVADWRTISGQLQPKFTLDAESALAAAAPTTSMINQALMDAFGIKANVGLAGTSITRTTENVNTNGQITETTTTQKKKEPGKAADVTLPPTQPAKEIKLSPSEIAKGDPFLRYQTAQALYQEVALLNSVIDNIAQKRHERAYVVRLRIGVVPYARNQPYDVYSRLSFFLKQDEEVRLSIAKQKKESSVTGSSAEGSSTEGSSVQGIRVVPVLAADNMEATDHAEAAERVRQLGIAIGLMIQGNGLNLGADKVNDFLKSASAKDYNSLLNMASLSANTLQARFGAARNGAGTFSMQERSQFITALVFVPDSVFARDKNSDGREMDREVDVIAHYDLRDPNSGAVVRELPPAEMQRKTLSSLADLPPLPEKASDLLKSLPKNCTWNSVDAVNKGYLPVSTDIALLFDLSGMLNSNDDICFRRSVANVGWNRHDWRVLWNKVAGLNATSQVSIDTFQLPEENLPVFAAPQTIILVDDGQTTSGTVLAGKNVVPSQTYAWLQTKDKAKGRLMGTVAPGTANGLLEVTFPSLSAAGLAKSTFELVLADAASDHQATNAVQITALKKPAPTAKPRP